MNTTYEDDILLVEWRQLAACIDEPTELFFPAGETGEAAEQTQVARLICQSCPVQEDCLEYALHTNQVEGIWGGLTPQERRPLRRRRLAERRRHSAR